MQSPLGAEVPDPATKRPSARKQLSQSGAHRPARGRNRGDAQLGNSHTVKADRIDFHETRIQIPVTNHGFQLAAQADLYKGRKKMTRRRDHHARGSGADLGGRQAGAGNRAGAGRTVSGAERGRGRALYSGADFPDAPIEQPIKKLMTAPFKMLVGLAGRRDRLYHSQSRVGRKGAVAQQRAQGLVRRSQLRWPGRRAAHRGGAGAVAEAISEQISPTAPLRLPYTLRYKVLMNIVKRAIAATELLLIFPARPLHDRPLRAQPAAACNTSLRIPLNGSLRGTRRDHP